MNIVNNVMVTVQKDRLRQALKQRADEIDGLTVKAREQLKEQGVEVQSIEEMDTLLQGRANTLNLWLDNNLQAETEVREQKKSEFYDFVQLVVIWASADEVAETLRDYATILGDFGSETQHLDLSVAREMLMPIKSKAVFEKRWLASMASSTQLRLRSYIFRIRRNEMDRGLMMMEEAPSRT